jgi:hypothetical protein
MDEEGVFIEEGGFDVAVSDFEFELIEVDNGSFLKGDGLDEDLDFDGGEGFELFEEGFHFLVVLHLLYFPHCEFVNDHLLQEFFEQHSLGLFRFLKR